MSQNPIEPNQTGVEPTKAGGCCGGHGSGAAAEMAAEPKAETTRSGGCCCGKGANKE